MASKAEWPFEGSPKSFESRRCREPNPLSIRCVCQYIKKRAKVNLSGTAERIYRLKHYIMLGIFLFPQADKISHRIKEVVTVH